MLDVGQEFKNYKEICKYLGEEVKTGKGKQLQLARWQLLFKWHNNGHKYVIDEVYPEKKEKEEKRGGNNAPHVKNFLPYVIYSLYKSGIKSDYIGTQRMMKSELKLITSEIYNIYNARKAKHTEYLWRHRISEYGSFTTFVHYFETLAKETLEGCLNALERGGGLHWEPAQLFLVGVSHRRRVYLRGYEEVLNKVETAVCNKMNIDRPDLKGRQYLHVVKRDPKLTEVFYKECTKRLRRNKKLMNAVREIYEEKYNQEFEPSMVVTYYRLYYIENVDRQKLRKWQLGKTDSIRMKKAFVNSVGPEMQTLKEKVYKDIFQRMKKNKKNKFGIPDEDFESMKLLFIEQSQKLTNRYYSPRKDNMQEMETDTTTLLEL